MTVREASWKVWPPRRGGTWRTWMESPQQLI